MQEANEKPVVYFEGVPQFWNWQNLEQYPVATLQYVFDHPILGNCHNVRTSVVLKVENDGTIETENTIYKPVTTEAWDMIHRRFTAVTPENALYEDF